MREILFRGKRIDNGEWVYGDLCHGEYGKVFILYDNDAVITSKKNELTSWGFIEVGPETIGQYTGMIDRNGNKIFEGDKVAFIDFLNGWETECIGEVIFSEYGWHFTNSITESNMHCYEPDDIEIIGNIHDEGESDGD